MQPRPAGTKSRTQARKRANADDSAFIGPSGLAGGKRSGERIDGAQDRGKRRRPEPNKKTDKLGDGIDSSELTVRARENWFFSDERAYCVLEQVDFHSLPSERLRRYLLQVEAMPILYPSPFSTETPPLPSSLLNQQAVAVRVPTPPSVGRIRRDARDGQQTEQPHRRRSSRLQEEDARSRRAPILADAEAVHDVLATLAERHFEKQTVNEIEALQQFLFAIKTRL